MSTSQQTALANVTSIVEGARGRIIKALPSRMESDDKERFIEIALGLVRTNTDLQDCDPASISQAIYGIAKLGLTPDPTLGHVYVVPFKEKRTGVVRATIIIGYRGMLELARRSGKIESITTEVVYRQDLFEIVRGTDERVRHVPWYGTDGADEPSGDDDIVLAYCVTRFKDGGVQIDVMTTKQIRKNAKNTSVWRDHFEEMCKKTVARRASKYWPLTTEISQAVSWDEQQERGERQEISTQLDSDRHPPATPTAADTTLETVQDAPPSVRVESEPDWSTE